MNKKFYLAEKNQFFIEEVHGSRELEIQNLESGEVVYSPNEDCKIPLAAIEIPDELYHRLFFIDQPAGKVICAGPEGMPISIDAPELTAEQLNAAARLQRNLLLRGSDWSQLPDIPKTIQKAWVGYRQDLRDVPTQSEFPKNIIWPIAPESA